jgi:nematocidal protein AidA
MSKIINILTTIDTDAVKKAYPNGGSTSPGSPTGIGHSYGYMVASGTTVNSGQGTGDLDFNALVGDVVRSFAVSGSDNFEDMVLLYGMPRFSGDQVFSTFQYKTFTKSTVVAGSDPSSPLPPAVVDEKFWFYQADVTNKGTEGFMMQFGLWVRDPNNNQPVLYGYFQWDPTIRVAG